MAVLRRQIVSRLVGPNGREGVTKRVFAGGRGNAMQAKGKKVKSRWSFNEN